jgi:hypothetical protein
MYRNLTRESPRSGCLAHSVFRSELRGRVRSSRRTVSLGGATRLRGLVTVGRTRCRMEALGYTLTSVTV